MIYVLETNQMRFRSWMLTAMIFMAMGLHGVQAQLHVASGETIVVTSADELQLNDDLSNSGEIYHLTLNGGIAQSIIGTGTMRNLKVNKTSGITANITSGLQRITDVLTLTSGTLATNGYLTLRSSAAGTARVAPVTGGVITGNVNVERYIPAARKWRMLTAPVTGSSNNSVYYHWQNNGSVITGTGVEVWGVGGSATPSTGNGLQTGPNPSMRKYGTPGVGWNNISDTKNEPLFSATTNHAFAVFVAGPFKNGSTVIDPSQAAVATTLNATGALITGTHTKQLSASPTAGQYFLVGNPYASPVDPAAISHSNLKNTFYMWSSSEANGVNRGLGVYVGFDLSNQTYSLSAANSGFSSAPSTPTPIQSGQAFFVQADQAGLNTTITFEEADKSAISGTAMFGPQQDKSDVAMMRLTLLEPMADPEAALDGAVAFFYPNGNAGIDRMDGYKLMNSTENIFFRRANQPLMFEHRPSILASDTLYVRIGNMRQAGYRLSVEPTRFSAAGLEARLIDLYAKKEQLISLASVVGYDFNVTADSASTGDRFRIVFTKAASNGGITAEPAEMLKMNPYPNPVVPGLPVRVDLDGTRAPWNLQLIDVAGRIVWQQMVKDPTQRQLDIDMSLMGSGVYQLMMTDANGQRTVSRIVKNR